MTHCHHDILSIRHSWDTMLGIMEWIHFHSCSFLNLHIYCMYYTCFDSFDFWMPNWLDPSFRLHWRRNKIEKMKDYFEMLRKLSQNQNASKNWFFLWIPKLKLHSLKGTNILLSPASRSITNFILVPKASTILWQRDDRIYIPLTLPLKECIQVRTKLSEGFVLTRIQFPSGVRCRGYIFLLLRAFSTRRSRIDHGPLIQPLYGQKCTKLPSRFLGVPLKIAGRRPAIFQ